MSLFKCTELSIYGIINEMHELQNYVSLSGTRGVDSELQLIRTTGLSIDCFRMSGSIVGVASKCHTVTGESVRENRKYNWLL